MTRLGGLSLARFCSRLPSLATFLASLVLKTSTMAATSSRSKASAGAPLLSALLPKLLHLKLSIISVKLHMTPSESGAGHV
ncbi:hypothetical protein GOP47_0029802 [Adiantum capillus-veneris]|nr:hypothetical protein GOP47_0029802 [Adiantum capillus-veneris]